MYTKKYPNILFFVLALIFSFEIAEKTHAQNCYRIVSTIRNKAPIKGFGFVIMETSDQVFLLTAKHVIKPKCIKCEVEEIVVYLQDNMLRAEIVDIHESEELAIIAVPKPVNFLWDNPYQIQSVRNGDKVYITGRFDHLSRSDQGRVNLHQGDSLEVSIAGVAVGSSGGPLLKGGLTLVNEKIVGMVIKDNGDRVTAISSQRIKRYVNEKLVQPNGIKMRGLPVIMPGLIGFGAFGDNMFRTLNDYYRAQSVGYGFYLDMAAFRYFMFSYQYKVLQLRYETMEPYLPANRYANDISTHTILLRMTFVPVPLKFNASVFAGASQGRIDPMVNLNNSNWVPLSDLGHTYSGKVHSIKGGYGISGAIFRNVALGMDVEIEYYFNRYASFNLIEPLKSDSHSTLFVNFNLYLGFILRPPGPAVKVIQ
jgi:hypothetical protein